ncbi:hypothetical protein CRYUN_Cryun05aG0129700 [Craigia yunnanensis]
MAVYKQICLTLLIVDTPVKAAPLMEVLFLMHKFTIFRAMLMSKMSCSSSKPMEQRKDFVLKQSKKNIRIQWKLLIQLGLPRICPGLRKYPQKLKSCHQELEVCGFINSWAFLLQDK